MFEKTTFCMRACVCQMRPILICLILLILFACLFHRTMGLIKMKSSDSKFFEVDRDVLRNFKMVEDMLECIGLNETNIDVIPLKQIDSKTLAIILTWAQQYEEQQQKLRANPFTEPSEQLFDFEQKLIDNYDRHQIFQLINAAHFLGAEALSDMLIKHIAHKCSTNSTARIRSANEIAVKKSKFE